MAEEKETCDNAPCSCVPQADSKYCGVICEGKRDVVELDCDCGHPECAGNF